MNLVPEISAKTLKFGRWSKKESYLVHKKMMSDETTKMESKIPNIMAIDSENKMKSINFLNKECPFV